MTPVALDERELLLQQRAVKHRQDELQELLCAAERAAHLCESAEGILSTLAAVQMQVHACRKAVVGEARATGHSDREVAAMLRLHVEDFKSRFPGQ